MRTFNLKKTKEIIEDLLHILPQYRGREERFDRFYLECLWFKQSIASGELILPLDTINGYYLSYVIVDHVFRDVPDIQGRAEALSECIQNIDIENF